MRSRLLIWSALLALGLAATAVLAGQAISSGSPPDLVVAQGVDDTAVEVAWTGVNGADSYRVYRDGAFVAEQPGTQYVDSPLSPDSPHDYAVSAVSGGIESALSTPASTRTQQPTDHTAPADTGPITVSDVTESSADLDWSNSTDNVKVVAYRILRGPAGTPPDQLTQIATSEGSSSYSASNLRSNTSYVFGVIAIDANNNHSPLRTVTFTTASTFDVIAPAAPSNGGVRTIPFSSSRIDVTWPTSTSSDVASYRVYRNGVQVGDVPSPLRKTFSDTGLTPATTYTYTIRTVDWAGNLSSATSGKVGTTPAAGTVLIRRGPLTEWITPSSARVAWWTNLPTASVVQYGAGGLTQTVTDPVQRTQHMMLIGGLTPGTQYQFSAGDGVTMSPTGIFSTASAAGSTFSFAAVGDFGGGSTGEQQVADAIAASGAQFTQTVGDNVYPDAADPDFETFYSDFDSRLFKQYGPAMTTQAFMIGNGNHEYYGDEATWRNFSLPNNERWFSYDWGDAHFTVLDTEQPYSPGTPQYAFASADLAAHQDDTWRIVIIHRPPYSSISNNSSSSGVLADLVPLFEQQHVQLVLAGHSHNYERTYPLIGGTPAEGGVVYVVTGGGGNGHNTFQIPQPSWSAYRNDTDYQYTKVTVSPQSIRLDAIRGDTQAVFDSTEIDAPPPPPAGTIIVKKDAQPDDPQDFAFTAGGGLSPTSFQLDDDPSDSALSDTQTFTSVVPGGGSGAGGTYSIAESVASGWDTQSAVCDDGSPPDAIDVSSGETVTCTFTNSKIYGFARPKAATPNTIRLVPAFDECTSPNATHGTPLETGSCNPPAQTSDYLTVGTPDLNGQSANFTGQLVLKVVGETPIDPNNGDQADVGITMSLTDVRNAGDLSDYTGELQAVVSLRTTDRYNGTALQSAATATDTPFAFAVPCSASGSPFGSNCNIATTADALVADLVREQERAVWSLGSVQVYDGGTDGDADTTGDNTLFAVQGLFVP
jgi:fibronectin type 3 domain-containing protein